MEDSQTSIATDVPTQYLYDGISDGCEASVRLIMRLEGNDSVANHDFSQNHGEKPGLTERVSPATPSCQSQDTPPPSLVSRIKLHWRSLQGWRFGIAIATISTSTVLSVNLILVISASIVFRHDIKDGIGTMYEGNCSVVSSMATTSHILINILGTMLLSASNYTMQVVCAPTRSEIDRAHAKGDWLDVGVPSVRNIMGRISKRHIAVWLLLAISSIPVHLIYNSVIFKTLDTNNYSFLLVTEEFLKGYPFRATTIYEPYYGPPSHSFGFRGDMSYHGKLGHIQEIFANNYHNSSVIQNLTNAECIRDYGVEYVSGRNHVLLITGMKANHSTNDSFYVSYDVAPTNYDLTYAWICPSFWHGQDTNCDISKMLRDPEKWSIRSDHAVKYCLSQLEVPHCKLQFSIGILVTVVFMNAIKAGCMFWTLWRHSGPSLITIGDALASFLNQPDRLSDHRCLMSKSDLRKVLPRWSDSGLFPMTKPSPRPFETLFRRRWFSAASPRRWILTTSMCLLPLIVSSVLLHHAQSMVSSHIGGRSVLALGFGSVDPREIIEIGLPSRGSVGLATSVLLSNMPQLIISLTYVHYNGLLTSMLIAYEWSRYYLRKKPLRVTSPKGKQRSTYYLHLPYRYSVPLLVASALLHWLVSESIFLVRIEEYKDSRLIRSSSKVGFSCLPILIVVLLGTAMVLTLIAIGYRKLASLMPVAGSCSAAISAACHPPLKDIDAACLAVSWGEIEQDSDRLVGHCTFTSTEVDAPTSDHVYL